jgi:hypothetical protein
MGRTACLRILRKGCEELRRGIQEHHIWNRGLFWNTEITAWHLLRLLKEAQKSVEWIRI